MKSMSRFTRVAISTGLVVATGAGVLGVTSFASAQLGQTEPVVMVEVDTTSASSTPIQSAPSVESESSTKKVSPLAVAATALSMTEADLRTELEAGKSIAQVAEAKGVEVATVVDALVAERTAHITAHVAEGKLTQEKADQLIAGLEERVTEMVNKTGSPMRGGPGGKGPRGGHAKMVSDELAGVLNMTVEELRTELKAGKSIADIAEGRDVELDAVKETLTAQFKARLAEHVADGKLTQEQADEKLATFEARLDDMVQKTRPEGAMGRRGDGHRGGGPRGFGGHMRGDQSPAGTEGSGASF